MDELHFQSSLTMEEVDENFKNIDFFSALMDGFQEALAYTKGKAAADTVARKRSLPDVNVVQVRASLDMTQRAFGKCWACPAEQ